MGKACSTHGTAEEFMQGLVNKMKVRDNYEDFGADGRIILINFRDVGWEVWAGFIWLWIRPETGSCEHGNEPSGSIKCFEFEWQTNCWVLKKGSAPRS
jgi:hypothetical protein